MQDDPIRSERGASAADGADRLFRAQSRGLRGLAYRLTGSAQDADDVVQESFARLLATPADAGPASATLARPGRHEPVHRRAAPPRVAGAAAPRRLPGRGRGGRHGDLHRLHHVPETSGQNLGTIFSCWDRMRGSLVSDPAAGLAPLGVPGREESYPQTWFAQLVEPFRRPRADGLASSPGASERTSGA